jgi:hypothetical protein
MLMDDESKVGVKRLCERFNNAAQKVGLQINEQITGYMDNRKKELGKLRIQDKLF